MSVSKEVQFNFIYYFLYWFYFCCCLFPLKHMFQEMFLDVFRQKRLNSFRHFLHDWFCIFRNINLYSHFRNFFILLEILKYNSRKRVLHMIEKKTITLI